MIREFFCNRMACIFFFAIVAICFNLQAYSRTPGNGDAYKMSAKLGNNVVWLRATFDDTIKEGYGFICGKRKKGNLLIATCNHLVRSKYGYRARRLDVMFKGSGKWLQAVLLDDYYRLPQDLAVLEVSKPRSLRWEYRCVVPHGTSLKGLKVKFIGFDSPWGIPVSDLLVNSERPNKHSIITVETNLAKVGLSGSPIIAENGIVGMILRDTGSGTIKALSIEMIKNAFNEWGYPWSLKEAWKPASRRIVRNDKEEPSSVRELEPPGSDLMLFASIGAMFGPYPGGVDYWQDFDETYLSMESSGSLRDSLDDERSGPGLTLNVGLMKILSRSRPSLAVWLSLGYQRRSITMFSNYNLDWQWLSGHNAGIGDMSEYNWQDSGKCTIIPVSFDLCILGAKLESGGNVALYFGPTVYFTKIHLKAHRGLASLLENSDGSYNFDWFPLEYEMKVSRILLGFNIGLDIEVKIAPAYTFFLGCQYYGIPKKKYPWEAVQKQYNGSMGNLHITDAAGLGFSDTFEFNPSTLDIHLGIRVSIGKK